MPEDIWTGAGELHAIREEERRRIPLQEERAGR